MGELFGTDGVRGIANIMLTPELAFKLGRAGASCLKEKVDGKGIVVGRDTRISGDMLEAALSSGICSIGMNVYKAGIMPTPGVAFLTRTLGAVAGAVISASHNPINDNGIKFFSSRGFKLPDELEERIEELVVTGENNLPRPTGKEIGRIIEVRNAQDKYIDYIKENTGVDLNGMKIVLDCAYGAAYSIAPRVFSELGAEVIVLHAEPDGSKINVNCGSTNTRIVQNTVVAIGADIGLAFDGDADRVIAVDETGKIVDGDKMLAILARDLLLKRKLHDNIVVATVMSNLGLEKALEEMGIRLIRTKVGDRYVLEEMLSRGALLGGEQSGHIIFLEYNTTGDGIITATSILRIMREREKTLSELVGNFKEFPQLLVNVPVSSKNGWEEDGEIKKVINELEAILKDRGRLLVRPSGTEPVLRIMAEGMDENELQILVDRLAKIIKTRMG